MGNFRGARKIRTLSVAYAMELDGQMDWSSSALFSFKLGNTQTRNSASNPKANALHSFKWNILWLWLHHSSSTLRGYQTDIFQPESRLVRPPYLLFALDKMPGCKCRPVGRCWCCCCRDIRASIKAPRQSTAAPAGLAAINYLYMYKYMYVSELQATRARSGR